MSDSVTARQPINVILTPFSRFARMEASGGILLLAATLGALIWANSPWESGYHAIWEESFTAGFGRMLLSGTRHDWIDDGLMSLFFFLVGLEIKRKILIGELSSLKRAMFPFVSAVGGTLIPALIYLAMNYAGTGQRGWGIPMATDIAFALGVLALLGNRVPLSLKVFVTALAIVDDIIAVLVIALFYTGHIHVVSLVAAAGGILLSWIANVAGVRRPALYAIIGIVVWYAVMQSGVHATVAGVLMAFTIPARNFMDRDVFLRRSRSVLDRFELAQADSEQEHAAIHTLQTQCELVQSPLHRIESALQPWISFLVMPLFAFANAGVHVLGKTAAAVNNPVALGVVLGLLIGKPVGISSFAWLAAKTGIAAAPGGVRSSQIFGASVLCGIGFTMSLFIATLAFGEGEFLDLSKIGILAASVLAAVAGSMFFLRRTPSENTDTAF